MGEWRSAVPSIYLVDLKRWPEVADFLSPDCLGKPQAHLDQIAELKPFASPSPVCCCCMRQRQRVESRFGASTSKETAFASHRNHNYTHTNTPHTHTRAPKKKLNGIARRIRRRRQPGQRAARPGPLVAERGGVCQTERRSRAAGEASRA